ncbi:hypothetical protein KQH61_04790 [bacterium]|nr:hypothetical protein [bacterium]MCB2179218.1 hypothetical protein [bacterium]
MFVPVTHVLPLTTIERSRMLPVAGSVLVRAGQEVRAEDVIAKANMYADHISLDLARGLGIPKHAVSAYIKRKIGDEIPEGGIIAQKSGVFSRVVRAPKKGILVAVGGGQALLQVNRKPYELKASIPGRVIRVEADYGAVIQVNGSWIQGVWGNGQIGTGSLFIASEAPDDEIRAKDIDPSERGQIMFASYCGHTDVLEQLVSIKMRGLILGSMPTRLRPAAAQMPYPIIVLEGFGRIPVNEVAFRLLSTSGQRGITVNAAQYDPATGVRPEIIIPVTGAQVQSKPASLDHIEEGKQVRILRAPYQGKVGTVQALPGKVRMPNGLHADAVEIIFDDEEKVLVPLANIEILG